MTGPREESSIRRDVVVLVALAALLRLGYFLLIPRAIDSADAVHYLATARTLADAGFLHVDPKIPLLYPGFVAIGAAAGIDLELAGRLVSLLFSCLLVLPVYLLAKDLHGRPTARLAGVLVALWPWLIDYGSRVSTEATAVFWWVLAVWLFTRGMARARPAGWMLGAALAFFALHLARPEGTFVLVGALGAGVLLGYRNVSCNLRRLALFGAVSIALLALYALYFKALTGGWTINHRLSFIGDTPEGSTVLKDFARTFIAMSGDVPAVMLGPLMWALAGVGLVVPGARPRTMRLEATVLYFAALQWLVVLPVLSPAPRYLMASLVVLLIWVARGAVETASVLRVRGVPRYAQIVPSTLLVCFMLFHLSLALVSERIFSDVPRQPLEYKVAGEWMRDHLAPGLIMSRKPQVGFYAEMETRGPPLTVDLEELSRLGKRGGFRYLVVDERYSAQMVPALRPLLDPEQAPGYLRLVRSDLSPYPAARVVVYAFDFGSSG